MKTTVTVKDKELERKVSYPYDFYYVCRHPGVYLCDGYVDEGAFVVSFAPMGSNVAVLFVHEDGTVEARDADEEARYAPSTNKIVTITAEG